MFERRQVYVLAMGVLTALFALRVAGQAVQFVAPQSFLPRFDDFQGSRLPYPMLLTQPASHSRLMLRICVRTGAATTCRTAGLDACWRGWAACICSDPSRAIASACRAVRARWFSTWIPAVFHLVLAGFVLDRGVVSPAPPQR